MSKARIIGSVALGLLLFDVLVNFSVAMMNTAMDVTVLVAVIAMIIAMRKEEPK